MAKILFLYVPCKNKKEAILISKELLNKKLIACSNIIDPITSLYLWEEKLRQDNETILIMKTDPKLGKKLITEIKKLHSYDIPAIISVPADSLNSDYTKWLRGCFK